MERLLAIDRQLSHKFTLSRDSGWWPLARIIAHIGDGPYVFGMLGLIYLLGWLWPDIYLRQAALVVAMIVFITMIIITGLKYLIRRQRPHQPGEFVVFAYDAYSFPSGHSGRMAALAVGMVLFYFLPGLVLIVITIGVALARMAVGIHYFSDVIVGLVIGTLVASGISPVLLSIILIRTY
jgi:undecaprenyl-diphosphatase